MARFTTARVAGCLALALCLGLYAAWAQEGERPAPARGEGAPQAKRIFYVVKHGSAKGLAHLLEKHFKGEVEVQALPDAAGNCLLLRVAPAAFADVVKLLEQSDRRPLLLAVDVWVAEATPPKGADGKPAPAGKGFDPAVLEGPAENLTARVQELRRDGVLGDVRHVRLTAVEHVPASVLVGESRPYVTGVTNTAVGKVARRISYRNVGTQVKVRARVADARTIFLDLEVDAARPHVPPDGIPIGFDETGAPIRATEFHTAVLKGEVRVGSGQVVAAQGVKTTAKAGQSQTVVFAAARILDPAAPEPKEVAPPRKQPRDRD
jgi:hypothetical protein